MEQRSLFERLGGSEAIAAVVDRIDKTNGCWDRLACPAIIIRMGQWKVPWDGEVFQTQSVFETLSVIRVGHT